MSTPNQTFCVDASTLRLDIFLANKTGESRSFVKSQIELGHVCVNDKPVTKVSFKLNEGDEVRIEFVQADQWEGVPIEGPLDIIHEEDHFLVLNKPQGIIVHPAASTSEPTLANHLLHYFKEAPAFKDLSPFRPGIVHRLDRGTSGLLLIAKDSKMQAYLSSLFETRQIQKTYQAVVWGEMEGSGKFNSAVGRDTKNRQKMSSRTSKPREALTYWSSLKHTPTFSFVELKPKTGRTHQLRVHLTEAGFPIVGDPIYGKGLTTHRRTTLPTPIIKTLDSVNETFLHARFLEFEHPTTKKTLKFEAPLPKSFQDFLTLVELTKSN